MRIIELEEIRLLKQSEKSTVLLVRETDGEQLFVRKILQGRHEIYGTLQSCPHPYLPKVYEAEISDDTTVVLEEYIDGQVLDSATLTEKLACNIIKELCAVLQFLHEKGIIHRDVKPSNIILAKDGHIRLIDFDAARMIKGDSKQDTRLLGTRGYAPPEQFGFAQTDTRTDIYALGMTMEQLLGAKAKKLRYKRIIRKCTDLNPAKRYQSIGQVIKGLSFSYRRVVALSVLAFLVSALSICVWHENAPPDYPDKSLLFYAENSDYMIMLLDSVFWDGYSEEMQVDIGKGVIADFSIAPPPEFIDVIEEEIVSLPDGSKTLLWSMGDESENPIVAQATELGFSLGAVPLWRPHRPEALVGTIGQITCVDIDKDGTKEVLVSKGYEDRFVITVLYRFDADMTFLPVGVMWGTDRMYLDKEQISAFVHDEFPQNLYHYDDGKLETISSVDFDEYSSYIKEQYNQLD